MKMKKQSILSMIMCIMLALSITISLAACTDENKSGSEDETKVLAEVDGTKITQGEVDSMVNFYLFTQGRQSGYSMKLEDLSEPQQLDAINSIILQYVDSILVKNYIVEKDKDAVEKGKTEVDALVASVISQSAVSGSNIMDEITSAGATQSDLNVYFEWQYYNNALYELLAKEQPVTDQEIQEFYDENKEKLVTPASIEVSHILINDAEHSEAGRTSIEAIKKRADKGEDFAKLAKKYGEDDTASNGGILSEPVVAGSGNYVEPFEKAALKLKKAGDISSVVETGFGYHIIKANTDLIPEQQIPLESVKEQIMQQIQSDHYLALVKKLKEDHKDAIKYFVDVDPETGEPPIDNAEKASAAAVTEPAITTESSATSSGSAAQ